MAKGKVAYLTLQSTREGQAAHAHVHEIVAGLRRREWDVILFEPTYDDKRPSVLKRLIAFVSVQLRMIRSLRGVDIAYVRWHFACLPAVLALKALRIPVVLEVNGPYEDLFVAWPQARRVAWLVQWMLQIQLRLAAAVVVVTEGLEKWIREEGGNAPIHVIPNGANVRLFHPGAQARIQIDQPYVVFFGALAKWQGIPTMLEAVRLADWPDSVCLVILGDGEERESVELAVQENRQVRYLGEVPYAEVPDFVAGSIAGLCPKGGVKRHASTGLCPLKVMETLSCGAPVIVTDLPGQADLVRSCQCGLVVPVGDAKALAQAVVYLYENPDVRREMGQRGRELIVEKHSWDHRAEATAAVLKRVIGTGK